MIEPTSWDKDCAEQKNSFGQTERGVVYIVQTTYLEHMIPDIIDTDDLAQEYVMFCCDWQVRGVFSTRAEAKRYADEYNKIPFLVSNVHKHSVNRPDTDLADLYETRCKLADVLRKAQEAHGVDPNRTWVRTDKIRIA